MEWTTLNIELDCGDNALYSLLDLTFHTFHTSHFQSSILHAHVYAHSYPYFVSRFLDAGLHT